MSLSTQHRFTILVVIFSFIGTWFIPLSSAHFGNEHIDGEVLFSPMYSTKTYLIDGAGAILHTWSSSYLPGVMVRWLGDGRILRTIRVGGAGPGTGGGGGGVQIVNWDGTVEWDFRYNTNGVLSHHDVTLLPNGNMLLIAWEYKTRTETIEAGRNPTTVPISGFWPDHVIEVQRTGPTSGSIVWEWHAWDHLIQDYDPTKENYGVVSEHPELIDINFGGVGSDWLHTNSIDYNEELDQILLSICYFNEIWVIDHSTTTQEALGHTGGDSGKGGDLLYRWGNPQTYDEGDENDQKLFNQHDATWIDDGCPGAGDILVFNNGQNRPGEQYSTIDEIIPPVDDSGGYTLAPGSPYEPTALTWSYVANPSTSFYANHLSGAKRLPDGNTIICNGVTGKIFEVTPEGATVWQYFSGNELFKAEFITEEQGGPPGHDTPKLDGTGSLSWTKIAPGATVTGSFQIQNIGGPNSTLNWTVDTSSLTWGTWNFTPQSGENLAPDDEPVTVHVSLIAPSEKNTEFQGNIRVENQDNSSDFDLIPVYLKTPIIIRSPQMALVQFLLNWIRLISERIPTFLQRFV